MSEAKVVGEFTNFLRHLIETDVFSGAVLIAKDGVPFFKRAYGLASQRFQVPNTVDTKFNLGSINKMFTAIAVAQLAEQALLMLDAPISKYLPYYPKAVAEHVTIDHLLTHTSGMGTYFNERLGAVWADLRSVEDFLPLFRDDPLAFAPGTSWHYSSAGFIVLGLIIEAVSGQSYFDYVREHIYLPAGMRDTDAYEMDRPVPNLAIGYTQIGLDGRIDMGRRRNNLFMQPVKGGPAGGGYSTLNDLLRFDIALRTYALLCPKCTENVLKGKVRMAGRSDSMYGYGFCDDTIKGHHIAWHNGEAPGVSTRFDMYRDLGYSVVVLSNYDFPIADQIANKLRELLL
jgi:CubicO group peptidase (beta-lactamase class C family)